MVLEAILAGALSLGAGFTGSTGLGEKDSAHALIRYEPPAPSPWPNVEVWYDSSRKAAENAGWIAGIDADLRSDWLQAGLGFHNRDGGQWAKQRLWIRSGFHHWGGRALVSSALSSRDRETNASLRWGVPLGDSGITLEAEASVILFDQGRDNPDRRVARLFAVRVLYRLR